MWLSMLTAGCATLTRRGDGCLENAECCSDLCLDVGYNQTDVGIVPRYICEYHCSAVRHKAWCVKGTNTAHQPLLVAVIVLLLGAHRW